MRTLLIGWLAAVLAGCNCFPPPQPGNQACNDTSGFVCSENPFVAQPSEPAPTSFEVDPKATVTPKTNRLSSAHARHKVHFASKRANSIAVAAKLESPAPGQSPVGFGTGSETVKVKANIASSSPAGSPPSSSDPMREKMATASAIAERAATALTAPEQSSNTTGHSQTALRGDAETPLPKRPPNTDHLVVLLMVRPEINSVADLSHKIIAIDEWQLPSAPGVQTAMTAAGAAEVQISESKALAIDRVISGEAAAAVLTLVSPEAAEKWLPKVMGFKIFRVPLSQD
jgi:hypothetical protein